MSVHKVRSVHWFASSPLGKVWRENLVGLCLRIGNLHVESNFELVMFDLPAQILNLLNPPFELIHKIGKRVVFFTISRSLF